MAAGWGTVKLAEVMRPALDPHKVDASRSYPNLGIYSFGRGVFPKQPIAGTNTSASTLYKVRAGQFIYSRLFAFEGAYAIVPPDLDGAYVSNEFPTFDCDTRRVDARYLGWLFKRPSLWREIAARSTGMGDRRQRIHPEQVGEHEIPLPPLDEQRRIVARIDALAAKIAEARGLREEASADGQALHSVLLDHACMGAFTGGWRSKCGAPETAGQLMHRIGQSAWVDHQPARKRSTMDLPQAPTVPDTWRVATAGELQEAGLILDIQDGNHGSEYPRKVEFGDDGVPFVTAKQISSRGVDIGGAPRLTANKASRLRIGFARRDDVLLTHNASVGDVAVAPEDAPDFLIGTSVTYWRCNPAGLSNRYMLHFMRSNHFQGQLNWIMKQTTRNQVSVLKQVNLWICVPPLEEQRRIVAELDALQAKVDAVKRLQTETAAELDTLLPAILDRAFKGEL